MNRSKPQSSENSVTANGHRIALYIRVSTEEQAENPEGSIKSQEQRLRANIQLRNMESFFGDVSEVFIDRARSGKDTNRPELQRMLRAVARNEISLIMVTELSRLSRSIKDFCDIWDLMRDHGCEFQSLREQFDTTSAAGEMVLYTIANIAQFERRQVAERVTANLQARSMRGLYNGGIVPLGYKTIPGKKGHLDIDEPQAALVRLAFDAFLKQESLTLAAKWLNDEGYRLPKRMTNGGAKPRMGHFTTSNLQYILRNKVYIGIKTHKIKDVRKEAKAVWEPIIDEATFARAQELLTLNDGNKKMEAAERYPFCLAGLIFCDSCGNRLAGKSAHGNSGKVPYYDHGWTLRKEACKKEKTLTCQPARVLAKSIESLVWDQVEAILHNPKIAAQLVADAKESHQKVLKSDPTRKGRERVRALCGQIDALAERIAELPKTIPASPFYKQMEKLIEQKEQEDSSLRTLSKDLPQGDPPAELPLFETFLEVLRRFEDHPIAAETRAQIVRRMVSKVVITENSFRLYFYVGQAHMEETLKEKSVQAIDNWVKEHIE